MMFQQSVNIRKVYSAQSSHLFSAAEGHFSLLKTISSACPLANQVFASRDHMLQKLLTSVELG